MDILSMVLIVAGLILFEVVSSIDNAVINAEVLSTMGQKARRWFLIWGLLFAVFVVRGLLPLIIIWATNPALGPIGALTATFSNDPHVREAIEQSAPILLMGGGVFLLFLFFHWLFLEDKHYGLKGERVIHIVDPDCLVLYAAKPYGCFWSCSRFNSIFYYPWI